MNGRTLGVVRVVDDLGRIVLPIELRDKLGFQPGDSVEYFADGVSQVMIRKYGYTASCMFCGSIESLRLFKDRSICSLCWGEVSKETS